MKKFIAALLILACPTMYALTEATNHTIMFPKEGFGSFAVHQASWHNMVYNKQEHGAATQVYAYLQSSLPNDHESEYFTFDNLKSVSVKSGSATGNPEAFNKQSFTRSILGQWLGFTAADNINTDFSITPEQKQYGLIFEVSQDLKNLIDWSFFEHLSIGISAPITHIENKLSFKGDTTILNRLQGKSSGSLNFSEGMQYLKLDTDTQTATNLANVKLNLGTKYQSEDDILIATNTTLTIPLAGHVANRKLFEPIVGYNGHIVMGSNVSFQIPLLVSKAGLSRVCGFFGLENKFLLQNHQPRTFEIRNKPFSRYMPILDRHSNTLIHGTTAFTKECLVEPFNIVDFIMGVRFKYKDSVGEIGYELWGHGTEQVSIKDDNPWDNKRYAIPAIDQNLTLQKDGNDILTASKSTINYAADKDGATTDGNIYIKSTDLNMQAAAASTALVHRGYATVGFTKKGTKRDCFANIGLFMEASQNNAAFNNWGGWFKLGFTF